MNSRILFWLVNAICWVLVLFPVAVGITWLAVNLAPWIRSLIP